MTSNTAALKQPTPKSRIWLLFGSLYFSQYVGLGFITVALITILRKNGTSLAQLSWLYVLSLPYFLKFLWAPLVDRYGRTLKAHYKNWLLYAQATMVICLLIASLIAWFYNPFEHITALVVILFVYITACATQDLSIDAIACRCFDKGSIRHINSIQIGSGLIGTMVGGGFLLMLYSHIQLAGCLAVICTCTLLGLLPAYSFDESNHLQSSEQSKNIGYARLITFWKDNKAWLWALMIQGFAMHGVFSLLNPFLTDQKWDVADIGFTLKVLGPLFVLIGVLSAGKISKALGNYKALSLYLCLQALNFIFFAWLLSFEAPNKMAVYCFVIIYFILLSSMFIFSSVIMMEKAKQSDFSSTDYTIQATLHLMFSYICSAILLNAAMILGNIYATLVGCVITAYAGYFVLKKLKHD